MALNIPMPGMMGDALLKGFDTGSNFMNRILQGQLARDQQKQADEHFKQQIALQKQQLAQSGANSALQRQILEQKLKGMKFDEAMQAMFMGGNPGATNPMQQQAQQQAPSEEMGQGMGMFTPEGLSANQAQAQAQNQQAAQSATGGMNLDMLKQNPMLRGWFKHHYGYDPLKEAPQTPEEKQAAALELFKQKEGVKAQNKGGDTPTNTVLTQNQQAIQGIDTVLPMLDDLIKNPDKVYGKWDFSPSKKAAYNAKTSGMIDTLVAAQSLPKVQASIDLVEQQIRRATNESDDAYIERIKDLRKDLVNRRGKAQSVIKNRKVNTESSEDYSNMSDEELRKIAGGG